MMDYSEIYPEIQIHVHNEEQAEFAEQKFKEIQDKFIYQPIDECTKAYLNTEVHRLQQEFNERYPFETPEVKLNGGLAYRHDYWSISRIVSMHKKYYDGETPEKETYTRWEVNNMLFDLCAMDIISGYEQVALPYSIAEDYNNRPYTSSVRVKCRYYPEDKKIGGVL